MTPDTNLHALLRDAIGARRASFLTTAVEVPTALRNPVGSSVSRAELSFALAVVLFEDLLSRVPMARCYLEERARDGQPLVFDHGALRTVAASSGALPAGESAFVRIFEPLGYERRDVYPLDRLGMTGRAWAHRDLPEEVPQYFVSELHPERFSEEFQAAVQRVVGESGDPLPPEAEELLARLADAGALSHTEARRLLPDLQACFDRQHPRPAWRDYEILLEESAEMAWIATEGNAFNHATDRVEDVAEVAEVQRRLGRPMKARLEVSGSGRVIQTAFRAAEIDRVFRRDDGHFIVRRVPGSFHEFITRKAREDGSLDLAFDASNAQGIFKMTTADGEVAP